MFRFIKDMFTVLIAVLLVSAACNYTHAEEATDYYRSGTSTYNYDSGYSTQTYSGGRMVAERMHEPKEDAYVPPKHMPKTRPTYKNPYSNIGSDQD